MEKHLKAAVGNIGTYQIVFKSGVSVILENVELFQYSLSTDEPNSWGFERNGKRISYTPHFKISTASGEKPLDDVIDAILHLK